MKMGIAPEKKGSASSGIVGLIQRIGTGEEWKAHRPRIGITRPIYLYFI